MMQQRGRLSRFFRVLFQLSQRLLPYIKYNEETIAEYYRKQGAKIGENCFIQIWVLSREPYLISIGNNVWISRNVVFHTHDGVAWMYRQEVPGIEGFGKIIIEDNCFIGAYSHLLPNIRIGRNSIVGINSVVIADVPPDSIVMGAPARVVGSSLKYKEKCLARWQDQMPPDFKGFEQNSDWFASNGSKKGRQILRRHLERLFDIHPPH